MPGAMAGRVAPRTGARIETYYGIRTVAAIDVAPRTGARIETLISEQVDQGIDLSPPARGRGLKRSHRTQVTISSAGRPPHGGAD